MISGVPAARALAIWVESLLIFLYDSLLVLELVDRIWKPPVEYQAIRDHDHGIEYLLVLVVMETYEPVGDPGNRVTLAAPCRVLDEIVLPYTVLLCIADAFPDGIERVYRGKITDSRLMIRFPSFFSSVWMWTNRAIMSRKLLR